MTSENVLVTYWSRYKLILVMFFLSFPHVLPMFADYIQDGDSNVIALEQPNMWRRCRGRDKRDWAIWETSACISVGKGWMRKAHPILSLFPWLHTPKMTGDIILLACSRFTTTPKTTISE
jgi:hypothetical protein